MMLFAGAIFSSEKTEPDFHQSVKKYSSDAYLVQSNKEKIEARAGMMFGLVEKSYTLNDRSSIKKGIAKKGILVSLQEMEFSDLMKNWQKNISVEKGN